MTLFLILAPYGVYAFLMLVTSATVSLVAAGAVCLATIAFDRLRGRSLKILPAGTAIVFAGIVAWLHLIDPALSDKAVKVAVDGGILAISLGSLLLAIPSRCNMRWNGCIRRSRRCRASCARTTSSRACGPHPCC